MAKLYSLSWNDFTIKLQQDFDQNESCVSELSFLFSGLTKWLEKKSLLHWHIKSFEEYIRDDLNPLGLRVQIFPTFDNLDPIFKLAWESILNKCSTKMMKLLIDEYQKRLTSIAISTEFTLKSDHYRLIPHSRS